MEQRLNEATVIFVSADYEAVNVLHEEICKKIPKDFSGTISICGNINFYGKEDLIFPKANLFTTGLISAKDIMVRDISCKALVCTRARVDGMAIVTDEVLCEQMEVANDLCAGLISAEYVDLGGDLSCNNDDIELLRIVGDIEQ